MSNEQQQGTATEQERQAIDYISDLRKSLYEIKERAELFRASEEGKRCGCELSLLITEVQSARHWGGECLAHFPTGYRVTDNPKDPGSESRGTK